ncbi:MAG: hypothetical protein HYX75_02785 [Acidobacteria bacterium]|nr:hypothetical protein [Acidobacteriota bacterium]
MMDQHDVVVIPLSTVEWHISANQDIALFQVSVKQGASTQKTQRDISV